MYDMRVFKNYKIKIKKQRCEALPKIVYYISNTKSVCHTLTFSLISTS